MPLTGRLADLEKNLELLYERLSRFERRKIISASIDEKVSLEQLIREEIQPEIYRVETEYWQRLAQEVESFSLDESEAEQVVGELLQTTAVLAQSREGTYPVQMIQLLTEMRNHLSELNSSSEAKLKATIPLFPPFLTYEAELETQGLLKQMFPTFSRLFRNAEKK